MSSSMHYRIDTDDDLRCTLVISSEGIDNVLIDDVPYHWLQLAAALAEQQYRGVFMPELEQMDFDFILEEVVENYKTMLDMENDALYWEMVEAQQEADKFRAMKERYGQFLERYAPGTRERLNLERLSQRNVSA